MPAAQAQAPQQLWPARMFMRPQIVDLGSQDFTLGGSAVTFPLRQLGYLQTCLLRITGTYTADSAALVFAGFGPWDVIQNVLVQTPNSPLPPINVSGGMLHAWNLRASDFAPFRKGFRTPGGFSDFSDGWANGARYQLDASAVFSDAVDQFPVAEAVGAAASLWWALPFALSDEDIRGVLPLGNSTVTNVVVTPNAAANVVTVAANLVDADLSIQCWQVYLSPPQPGSPIIGGGVDISWTQVLQEQVQAIAASGLQSVDIVPNYTIMGIAQLIRQGGSYTLAGLSQVNVRLNQAYLFAPPGLTGEFLTWKQAMEQGRPMPDGVLMLDQDILGPATWIDTAQLTELQVTFNVPSRSAGDTVRTGTRSLVLTQR